MISPTDIKDVIKYLGARMSVAVVAVTQHGVVVYLVGADALHFTTEGEVAAIVMSGVVAASVGVTAIIGRTATKRPTRRRRTRKVTPTSTDS